MNESYYKFPKGLVDPLIDYLKRRPFQEVAQFLQAVQEQVEGPFDDSPEGPADRPE